MAVVAVLIALLLPAVQAARASARATACRNNLKQLGLAACLHLSTHRHYPTGGWGASWTGDPSGGYGSDQPGGWIYGVLEGLEFHDLRASGASGGGTEVGRSERTSVLSTPIPVVSCPARRRSLLYPFAAPYMPVNYNRPTAVARSDYAANAGTVGVNTLGLGGIVGPSDLKQSEAYLWPPTNITTGIVYARSETAARHVTDGISKTFLAGEKYVGAQFYESGLSPGDGGFALMGFSPDSVRMTRQDKPPRRDGPKIDTTRFGSAHPTTCLFVLCDGTVVDISFDISPYAYAGMGNRRDGAQP